MQFTAGAAGTGYTMDFSTIADRSNEVNEGDKIRFISNGGADNSNVGCMLNAVISPVRILELGRPHGRNATSQVSG